MDSVRGSGSSVQIVYLLEEIDEAGTAKRVLDTFSDHLGIASAHELNAMYGIAFHRKILCSAFSKTP